MNPSSAPIAPTGIVATAGSLSASVAFNAVSGATYYTVTSSPGNIVGYGTSSPIVVNNLNNGTAYTFSVVAVNATGSSPVSSPSVAVTPAAKNNGIRLVFMIFLALIIVGGLNWGLVSINKKWDLVEMLGNLIQKQEYSVVSRIVYALVGVAAIVVLSLAVSSNKAIYNNN